jgi:hypothetical protein
MFRKLLATAFLLLLAPAASLAADPVITYQTQPLGRMLNDLRMLIQSGGGDEAVKSFNKNIKESLGDKGFDGFDLSRPIVGYIDAPAAPEDFVAVVAFPITAEKDWLDFCERWTKVKPKALKDGLYEVPAPNGGFKAVMKISEGYAYIATGMKDPARVLNAKTIVPFATLYDGTDISLMVGKLHFDRIPKELRGQAKTIVDQLKQAKLPGLAEAESQAFLKPLHSLASRFLDLSEGAKDAVLRVNGDPVSGETTAELTVTPVGGSALEKAIAGLKPGMNRFASLITPDAAGVVRIRLPLDIPEVKAVSVAGLEALQNEAKNNNFLPIKAIVDELLKGAIRTVKSGEVEGLAVLRGPAKDGTFTGVAALTFDDPSGFEKEMKKFIEANAPQDFKHALKWDAEKANGVNIHTIDLSKMPGGDREIKALFGNNATVAFAFGPKASYVAIGPGGDAVGAIEAAMAAKPGPAPLLDFALNPDRIVKLIGTIEPQGAMMAERMLGKQDKLLTNFGLDVTGGTDLKIKVVLNLKSIGSTFLGFGGSRTVVEPGAVEELKK